MNHSDITYESQIIQWVRKDNVNHNTMHFEWDRTPFSPSEFESGGAYILRVITHNIRTGQNFLLKEVSSPNRIECFEKMISYVRREFREDHNYIVRWKTGHGLDITTSYFRGKDKDEVKTKFYHDFTGELISIEQSPIA